jgi:ABC-type branched-subunit amino acid transport system ATPase component
MAETAVQPTAAAVLEIRDLWVQYGHVPALQGVTFSLAQGVLAVVGRNGMGKTTLCNAITGLVRASRGSIRFAGAELVGLAPNEISNLGIGYVPQGRRVWPSLTVDEHLRLAVRMRSGPSSASTTPSRGSRSGAAMAAPSFRVASSRCWPSAGLCSGIRASWSWTSRPRAWRRSSSSRSPPC